MSQFATYVQSKGLSLDQIFHCSARIERHRVEDRQLRVQRQELRRAGKPNRDDDDQPIVAKPRSGRGVSRRRIADAWAGQPLTPRVRAKLARAVATLLASSSGEPVDARLLFGDVPSHHHQSAQSAAATVNAES
jgi:hypothetical protein